MTQLIGIDVGGTNLRVGVVDGLQVLDEQRCHADFSQVCAMHPPNVAWEKIIETTAAAIMRSLRHYPQVSAIGIGFPGFINPLYGTVAQSPNLPGLRDVDLAGSLTAAIGLPVFVENDACIAALGEYLLLDTQPSSMVYIGLGTGVGGGLIYQGRIFSGQHGVAMEVGHMIVQPEGRPCGCGNRGCVEQYASASGVALSYEESTGAQLPVNEIAALARQGDVNAIQAFELAGMSLAMMVADIVKVLDVGTIVVGGGLSNAWDIIVPVFDHQLARVMIPILKDKVEVRVSVSGDKAGIIGAANLAGSLTVR